MFKPYPMVQLQSAGGTVYVSLGHIVHIYSTGKNGSNIHLNESRGMMSVQMSAEEIAGVVRQAGGVLFEYQDAKGKIGYVMANRIGYIEADRKGLVTFYYDGTSSSNVVITNMTVQQVLQQLAALGG